MLSPYTVLDLSDNRGELAAMILGDLGADVIKVEPPQGSSSRRMAPFMPDAPEPEGSLHYFAFNRNKRGITLDLSADAGCRALVDLVKMADFVIESASPGEMSNLGLGFDDVRRANPRIVYVAITPYGQDGPHAKFAASDLTLAAMGGPMSVQGDPGRAPVRISVPQVWLHASGEAAVAALTAHARMMVTGEAQFVDVSAQTVMIWTMLNCMTAYAIQGFDFNRAGGASQSRGFKLQVVFECADGYVALLPIRGTLTTLILWCVRDGLVPEAWLEHEDWSMYDVNVSAGEPVTYPFEEVFAAINRYFLDKTKNQIFEQCLREGVSIAPVNTIEELTRFRQLEERGFWLTAPLPNGQEIQVPGLFARLNHSPMKVRRWSPKLGQHNNEVLGGMLGYSSSDVDKACGLARK
jgi:crotonobetainyl-CoA:carnitine CoA-transferase CaiB-like acyl-CoA transferase